MIQEREKKLNDIQFVWDPSDESWEMHCGALKEYMEKNGGKFPIRKYTHPMGEEKDDLKLGSWCHTQRKSKNKKNLSQEREKKLDTIKSLYKV